LELKISAYTDRSGAPAAKKVAIDRAAAVEKELVTLGVPKERLATGGRPLVCASAIHDECQAQSRRATVLITAR
jgi:outer membrane protein OmpA-like peptidoglycan-associated protein